jgi:hypothetical protein
VHVLGMPGNDLLSRLGSTIGAGAFHGRVRDGIGWGRSAKITRQTKHMHFDLVWFFIAASLSRINFTELRLHLRSDRCNVLRTLINESNQANRAISTGKLHMLPRFHTQPINVVVYNGSQGKTRFEVGFPLRCLQRLSLPHLATLHCRWRDNRSTRGASIPVLSY